jgi:hypothetical protein
MDEPADRGYSRAPELEDLVGPCRSLNREGVRHVLIGGFVTILHGSSRTTKDVDLLVDPSADNVRSLGRALAVLPDNGGTIAVASTSGQGTAFRVRLPVVRERDDTDDMMDGARR